MIYFEKAAISQEQIQFLFDLYRHSTNWICIDGVWRERHNASGLGHFLLSEFSKEEISIVWSVLQPKLELQLGLPVELSYARILKYTASCFIQNHIDSYTEGSQASSDISFILQLNDSQNYKGGSMIVSKQLVELSPGDAVFYTYDHEHEVKPVKSGVRYVLNLRLKRVK
jgi:hypothetical protein